MNLRDIGWDDRLAAVWEAEYAGRGLEPGRIASSLRGAFIVWTEHGDVEAPARPKLIRRAESKPCTGDWVALRTDPPVSSRISSSSLKITTIAPSLKRGW